MPPLSRSINRIRLEFKVVPSYSDLNRIYRINRIRLEFKVYSNTSLRCAFFVLIESDWNLKTLMLSSVDLRYSSINRIRLEFKVVFVQVNIIIMTSINRIRLEFKG